MFMNDKQVAVSDVILRLLEASDYYDHGANAVSDADLAKRFAARGRQCSDTAESLKPHIHRLGELPSQPDPEREILDHILSRIANIGVDERSRFAKELGERESAIEQAARDALLQPLPKDTLRELGRIQAAAAEHAGELARLVREK
jgi:hypothetical protein